MKRKNAYIMAAVLTASLSLTAPAFAEEGMLSAPAGGETDGGSVFSAQVLEEDPVFDAKLQETGAYIASVLPQDNGAWSFYIGKAGGTSCYVNDNTPRRAASLIKLFIMGAVYERYEELCGIYGQGEIDEQLLYMITVSDNDCANSLTTCLGGGDPDEGRAAVTAYAQAHGFYNTVMGRMLLAPADNGDNITSAADCGEFLMQVYRGAVRGENVSLAHPDRMLDLLSGQERRNKIPSLMPENITTANKTGELSDVENDAAILYHTPVQDLVIVFMGEGLADCGSGQYTISERSLEIYNRLNPS